MIYKFLITLFARQFYDTNFTMGIYKRFVLILKNFLKKSQNSFFAL